MKTHVENIKEINQMIMIHGSPSEKCKHCYSLNKVKERYFLALKSELEFLGAWKNIEANNPESNFFLLQSFKIRIADCEEAIKLGDGH